MRYFLKKTNRRNDVYLQIYVSDYLPEKKGNRNHCCKSLGYLSELRGKDGVGDPIAFYQKEVRAMNERLAQEGERQISDVSREKNVGYFILKAVYDKLGLEGDLRAVSSTCRGGIRRRRLLRVHGLRPGLQPRVEAQVLREGPPVPLRGGRPLLRPGPRRGQLPRARLREVRRGPKPPDREDLREGGRQRLLRLHELLLRDRP